MLQAGRTARQTGLTLPILSNVGRLAGDQSIAGCPISQLFLLPAGFALPAVMLGVSSWNGRLTATLVCRGGFCPSALDPARLFLEIDR